MNAKVSHSKSDPLQRVGLVLSSLLPVGTVLWAFDVFRKLGINLFDAQFYAGMLAFAYAAMFLIWTPRGCNRSSIVALLDVMAAVISFLAAGYVAAVYPELIERIYDAPADAILAGTIMVLAGLEGIRRTTGPVLALIVLLFLVFAFIGHYVPGDLQGRYVRPERLFVFMATDPNAILGMAMRVCTTIVIAFVLFGSLLSNCGGSEFFSRISASLFGRSRGGSAKISIVASGLFGSISGSAVSNVLSTGVMTIPMMRRSGYPATSAASIEAVASTGGQIMPPVMGAAAFLMAEFLQVSYGSVVVAALIPAFLYYLALFILVDLEAAKYAIDQVDDGSIAPTRLVLAAGWHFIVPFVIIIFALFYFLISPELSAIYGLIALFLGWIARGYDGKRASLAVVKVISIDAGRISAQLMMICVGAGIIIGVLNISALGFALALVIVLFGQGNLLLLLLLAAVICIILGMGMPTAAVYVLLATLISPALVELNIDPMAAHLFVLYFGMMSMTTPPVAIAAFAAASIAGTSPMRTAWITMRYAWSAYVIPFLFVLSPALLLKGPIGGIALALIGSISGIWLISCSILGYMNRELHMWERLLALVAGILVGAMVLPYKGVVIFGAAGLLIGSVLWFVGSNSSAKQSAGAGQVPAENGNHWE
jgi:TRAP transporter 4TM/12TM fusion protein